MQTRRIKDGLINLALRAGFAVSKAPAPCWVESHLRDIVRLLDVTVALDVGANVGEYAHRLRRLSRFGGRIVSFEPEPRSMQHARRRMEGDGMWTGVQLALGREPGHQVLNVHSRSLFSSFLEMNEYGVGEYGGSIERREDVEVARLDDVAGQYLSPEDRALLKIDTQGYDIEVIEGGRKTIAENVVALQVEVPIRNIYEGAPTLAGMVDLVDELGFDITWISPFSRRPDLRLVECDFVARRRET